MAHDVFISYSNHDKAVADAACAILENRGIRCWMAPRDVTPGMDWSAEIIDAIEASRVMVLIYSASANQSPQIKREVERAVSKGLPILPFRIEDVPMSKALEFFISSPHWLDALTPPMEQHLNYLAQTVQLLLSRKDQTPGVAAAAPRPVSTPPPPRPPVAAPATPLKTDRSKMTLLVGGVIALLALGFGGYQLSGGGGGEGGTDRAMVGEWTSVASDPAGLRQASMSIKRDGSYEMRIAVRDSGTITASGGQYQMINASHVPVQGTYSPVGPSAMSMTGPLGTGVWTRTGGPSSQRFPLAGQWNIAFTMDGAPWRMNFDIGQNGAYRLVSETSDAGQLVAGSGSYTMTSTSGKVISGTYQVLNANSVATQGPAGPAVWQRR